MENKIVEAIQESVLKNYKLDLDKEMIRLEIPKLADQGDYASNIALRLAKELKMNPRAIASKIEADVKALTFLEKIEIAGPGFINFFIKAENLADVALKIIEQGSNYGRSSRQKESVLLEYVSANPTGKLHVGHARGAAWGDALARIMDFAGYKVLREYYINDLGNQINMLAESIYARYQQIFGKNTRIPEDGYHGEDIQIIAQEIAKRDGEKWLDQEPEFWYEAFKDSGVELELKQIKADLEQYRVEFDSWISEKSIYEMGRVEKVIADLKKASFTYEQDDALWFKSSQFVDDKDRVLIKSDGSYTYLVPDIAYHLYKLERNYDRMINFWGGDHHGYIPRMVSALEAFGHPDVLDVDIIQMVRLIENGQEVKMSKRSGQSISLSELLEDIGVDAARYFFVSRSLNTQLDFDLDLARRQTNENPVFYAQYAHARIHSILKRAPEIQAVDQLDLLIHEKEMDLLKHLNEFPKVVLDVAESREVQKMTHYIHRLANLFHSFYASVKVIDEQLPELTNQRLHLLKACQITLENALNLIAVSAPESM